eukprot:scaffold1940_cov78-Phaeocystis_antarctica.AAC.6
MPRLAPCTSRPVSTSLTTLHSPAFAGSSHSFTKSSRSGDLSVVFPNPLPTFPVETDPINAARMGRSVRDGTTAGGSAEG